jgi:ATP phosphoribosyltransferase
MTSAPLVLAVPSKGRLQENASTFFSRAGLHFSKLRGAREYRGTIAGLDGVEVAFLSASEIVANLAQGTVHLGVTGEDLVREQISDSGSSIEMLTPLGFGQANVVVAVPQAWIDVRTMADLDDVAAMMRAKTGKKLRVATKYVNLTRNFFASHGLADYRIVESLGATEGAPAAGTAEIVVDITTTGSTLSANALKVLDDGMILSSEANLVASLKADWPEETRRTARAILSRIAAEEDARGLREVCAKLSMLDDGFAETLMRDYRAVLPFGLPVPGGTATIHCPEAHVFALAGHLSAKGAGDVTVRTLDYVFRTSNPLADKLFARLQHAQSA